MSIVYSGLNDRHLVHTERMFDRFCALRGNKFKRIGEGVYHYSNFISGSLALDEYDLSAPNDGCQVDVSLHLDKKSKRITLFGDVDCAILFPRRIERSLRRYGSFDRRVE